jgi:hypothetical protein
MLCHNYFNTQYIECPTILRNYFSFLEQKRLLSPKVSRSQPHPDEVFFEETFRSFGTDGMVPSFLSEAFGRPSRKFEKSSESFGHSAGTIGWVSGESGGFAKPFGSSSGVFGRSAGPFGIVSGGSGNYAAPNG